MLRWLDELNEVGDAETRARELRAEIRALRREPNSVQNRRAIRKLYEQLDAIQFKPDYVCVIMDRERDYLRACKGFTINGLRYHRLLGTNGGIKNETIVFIADRHGDEIRRRIENGRDRSKELVPAKFEAYKALTCSASLPVSMPNGVLVVPDCETKFVADTIYLNDEADGEPVMEERPGATVELDESDGYGLMLPSLAERWAEEIRLGYTPSGVNTRFSFEKGMVFTFDFREFAEKVAGTYLVKDAWGVERDVRDVELILTTSMVKLWDSYPSCEEYLRNSAENGYTFGITKVAPERLESERTLNYQFIQSYELSAEDVEELIAPTVNEIRDILYADCSKTVLFLRGCGLTDENVDGTEDVFAKALMIEPRLIDDPYIRSRVYQLIRNRINEAKVGCLRVHGNYSIVCGDPYSLCQSVFGLPVTGLLKAGEIFNRYWLDAGAQRLACYRAPMTCHNNVRLVGVHGGEDARYWYRYMPTVTIFNSWDTAAAALNGMDKDGDLVMLTDNDVLLRRLVPLPALMCIQRRAEKRVVSEEDLIRANIGAFGDDIGKITNRITTMYEVQSHYPKDSEEYRVLDYRIRCGQLFQQNSIDKAKGIIAKPMPPEWYDRGAAAAIEDEEKRSLYLSILADRKPYFMRYIYPDLMRRYNTYIKNTNKKAQREFGMTAEDVAGTDDAMLTEEQREFKRYYLRGIPVGMGNCVTNLVCRRFEEEFDGFIGRRAKDVEYSYEIMKSGTEYSRSQYNAVTRLFRDYNARVHDYMVFASRERVSPDEARAHAIIMNEEFRRACDEVCTNAQTLCDILLDVCYRGGAAKNFVWWMCADEIIANLLGRNGGKLSYPVADENGEIEFHGKRFSIHTKEIGGTE